MIFNSIGPFECIVLAIIFYLLVIIFSKSCTTHIHQFHFNIPPHGRIFIEPECDDKYEV